jgi:hypothetical protein
MKDKQGNIMNAIQQISLKLQMGIAPEVDIQPQRLRAMWLELTNESGSLKPGEAPHSFRPRKSMHPSLNRAV